MSKPCLCSDSMESTISKSWDIQGHLNTQKLNNIRKLLTFCSCVIMVLWSCLKKNAQLLKSYILQEMKKKKVWKKWSLTVYSQNSDIIYKWLKKETKKQNNYYKKLPTLVTYENIMVWSYFCKIMYNKISGELNSFCYNFLWFIFFNEDLKHFGLPW